MQVRPCISVDEMREAMAPIWHYFGQMPPTEDSLKHFARILEPQRVHAGFDGTEIVSGFGLFAFDLTVPVGSAAGTVYAAGTENRHMASSDF
jgi:hypothetical protein